MRMRKKKHADERLSACSEYILNKTESPMTNPADEVFGTKDAPVYLEIGAGKGGFACGIKKQSPDVCYFAMERVSDCVVLGAERAKNENVQRLKFVIDTADNLTKIFGNSTVDAMFLNFSDPWSKKGYAKRRLTHKRYLAVYLNLLKDGGTLTFKTDNVGLFDFTLEQIEEIGLTPVALTRDLHRSEYSEGNVVTEYEEAFSSQGININMVRIRKPEGFVIDIPNELLPERDVYRFGEKI